jgi:heme O synthase-like polyprenyltransferase
MDIQVIGSLGSDKKIVHDYYKLMTVDLMTLCMLSVFISAVASQDHGDQDEETNHKRYILYLILAGLVLFLLLAAFIIETLLSKSKRDESRVMEEERLKEKQKEKTQIESNFLNEQSANKANPLQQPIMEEHSRESG